MTKYAYELLHNNNHFKNHKQPNWFQKFLNVFKYCKAKKKLQIYDTSPIPLILGAMYTNGI